MDLSSRFLGLLRTVLPMMVIIFTSECAVAASPVGLWKTIDDKTGQAKSLIRIDDNDGILQGVVEKILPPEDPDATCGNCPGDLKDKPVLGMTILSGMTAGKDGYKGGQIMDPENGKTYKCLLWLDESDPSRLNVRGYIGVPLFGRSQLWIRSE